MAGSDEEDNPTGVFGTSLHQPLRKEFPVPVRYVVLSEVADRQALAEMTYPAYRECLLTAEPGQETVGVVAFTEGKPCGLALAQLCWSGTPAEVLSVFVERSRRGQGIGGQLLARITDLLKEQNEPLVLARYPRGRESTPAVEYLLANQGWGEPRPHLLLFRVGKLSLGVLHAPWMQPRPLPTGFTLFEWAQSTEADLAVAAEYHQDPDFPPGVTPFREEDSIDPRISLGLREQGRLVGWLVTHRINEGMTRYACLFVHPSVSVKGLGWRLITQAIRRQIEANGHRDDFQAVWAIAPGNPLAGFVRRCLAPHMPDFVETLTMECEKVLASLPEGPGALRPDSEMLLTGNEPGG
jgi:GNAT superfamily N-acetyltransferase